MRKNFLLIFYAFDLGNHEQKQQGIIKLKDEKIYRIKLLLTFIIEKNYKTIYIILF